MAKKLMKGNVAMAEAAVQAGLRYYFGYPITPQNEVPEYLSKRLREVGGVFKQAESELASINMVYGASAAGGRTMTSSSGLGIALMQEGISNLAATEIPAVVLNVARGGPGIGTIQAAQSDYFQMTRGGGDGDYYSFAYAPWDLQEACDLIQLAFDKADEYRMVAQVYVDATLGAMMESVDIKENTGNQELMNNKPWALTSSAHEGGGYNKVAAVWNEPINCQEFNLYLKEKYDRARANETMVDLIDTEDADVVIVAYGTTARIATGTLEYAKEAGLKVGMVRPVTLWPFPYDAVYENTKDAKAIVVAEMAISQLIDDVKIAVDHDKKIIHHGTCGGVMPSAKEMFEIVKEAAKEVK
jgi:2-oxoglutarate ferredoxin oxidoreductase subunit alpha